MLSVETKLAIAAAFRGTMIEGMFLTQENVKNYILLHMQDYFHYNPVEGSQFDSTRVLDELEAVNPEHIGLFLDVLAEIGFRTTPHCEMGASRLYQLETNLWEQFCDDAAEEWNKEKSEQH